MKIPLWLLCMLSLLQDVRSQISLEESSPGTVKPGDTLDVTCKVTGASLIDSTNMHCVHWIRQVERDRLEWLGRICHNEHKDYASSLQGRLTLTRDTNKGEVYCKLTGMKREESGTYYCARYSGSYWAFDIWSPGTFVTVSSAAETAPSLFPLISCGTSQEARVTVGCLAKDYFPDSINFSWTDKSNNSFSDGFRKYSSSLQPGGTYAATSHITVPSNSWENQDPYYCQAKHSKNTKTVKVMKTQGQEPRAPIVTMHPPVSYDLNANGNGTIVFIVSKYYPKPIEVTWMKNYEPAALNIKTEEAVQDGNGDFTTSYFITVSKKEWDSDTVYSILVKHIPSQYTEMKNISKSISYGGGGGDCPGLSSDITVYAIPPSFEVVYLTKTAPLTCVIANMLSKDGLEVSWYVNEEPMKTELGKPEYFPHNNTHTIRAIATVCPEDWNKKTFECRVKHPDIPSLKKVQLSKPNGKEVIPPQVYLYPPHQDELKKKETVTITCLARGFSPEEIFVKWFDYNNIEQTNVVNTEPKKENISFGTQTFYIYSKLTVEYTDWNDGKTFTCVVGHESLPLQAIQRSIDKTAGNSKSVNVTLVMSDTCS